MYHNSNTFFNTLNKYHSFWYVNHNSDFRTKDNQFFNRYLSHILNYVRMFNKSHFFLI